MRLVAYTSVFAQGIASVGPQLLALVLLTSFDFGRFSIAYLIYAFAISVTFSLLCDPWAIVSRHRVWPGSIYSSVLTAISAVFAVAGGFVLQIVLRDLTISVVGSVAVFAAVYRLGARHFLVHSAKWGRALVSDIASIAGLILGSSIAFYLNVENIFIVLFGWIGASLSGMFLGPVPRWSLSKNSEWLKGNRGRIRPLLADSLMMDASSIGTPFLLLPVLGVSAFGIYRGISNLSAPVRLLLAPIRTIIISSPKEVLRPRRLIMVFIASIGFGVTTWAGLSSIDYLGIDIGVLTELAAFDAAAGVYLFGAVLLSIFPLIIRSQDDSRLLLIGRLGQTFLLIAAPLAGHLFFGLSGAIWGYALSTTVSGIVWLLLAFSVERLTEKPQ